jgi:hypothetical protein
MATLIDLLRSFNRKERFYLVGKALGNPGFKLGRGFRGLLKKAFGLPVPENAFVAMDYHFDWIYASLFLASPKADEAVAHKDHRNQPVYACTGAITANQEDVDLLIAFPDEPSPLQTHLLLLEAKLDTGWTNKQFRSKAKRLKEIFGEDGDSCDGVIPHFAILSPDDSLGLDKQALPKWACPDGSPVWIEFPKPKDLQKVTRCNRKGVPDKDGKYWTVYAR